MAQKEAPFCFKFDGAAADSAAALSGIDTVLECSLQSAGRHHHGTSVIIFVNQEKSKMTRCIAPQPIQLQSYPYLLA